MPQKMSRREFLKFLLYGSAGVALSSCAEQGPPPTPETITVIETVEVVKEGEKVIETVEVIKEVTATPEPTMAPEAVADVMGTFPRRETLTMRR